jgi:transcriptional regulator with XRE-family HTH domain
MMKTIGERIRRIRAMKDYTQSNVAEDLGMTTGAYAKIERGETDANVSRLLRIAEILEVNVCDFFEDARKPSVVSQPENVYGYASRYEVEQLSKSIQQLLKEMEKIKEQLQERKPAKKSPKKK